MLKKGGEINENVCRLKNIFISKWLAESISRKNKKLFNARETKMKLALNWDFCIAFFIILHEIWVPISHFSGLNNHKPSFFGRTYVRLVACLRFVTQDLTIMFEIILTAYSFKSPNFIFISFYLFFIFRYFDTIIRYYYGCMIFFS